MPWVDDQETWPKILSGSQKKGKAKAEKGRSRKKGALELDKYFNRSTSENPERTLEESHHSKNGDNVSSQPDDMPDSHKSKWKFMYGKRDKFCFEIVEFDKDGSWSDNASDKACEHEKSKIFETVGLTNAPATWPGVIGMLATIQAEGGPPTITTEVLTKTRIMWHRFLSFTAQKSAAK